MTVLYRVLSFEFTGFLTKNLTTILVNVDSPFQPKPVKMQFNKTGVTKVSASLLWLRKENLGLSCIMAVHFPSPSKYL